jgi:signal transduction histidine kinase/ActR/RegA family two-component response regulator
MPHSADQSASAVIKPSRRRRVSPTLTLVLASVVALCAISAVVALSWHANGSRDNEANVDDVMAQVNTLQNMPWRLQISLRAPGSESAGTVAARMDVLERRVRQEIDAQVRKAPVDALVGIDSALTANFGSLNYLLALIERGESTQANLLYPAAFTSHDRVAAALERATVQYHADGDDILWEATVGTIAVLLLLLGGFVWFFNRSHAARKAADVVTDDLRHSEEHLERAQSVAGIGSWEWNDRDRVVQWSAEQARLHGWTDPLPPTRPRDMLALVAPGDRARVQNAMRESFQEGKTIELDYRVAESRGGRLVHVHAANVIEPDGGRRLIGTTQDVTDRFRRAEAERANQAKNEFISRMSHELRTPLNAVLGFGQLMSMSDLDERQRGNAEHILAAGRHLLDLINEILDISRIESGDLRLSPEAVATGSVISDAIDLVTPIASEHQVSVTVDTPKDEVWVRADVQRLRQVLLNLLSNAVKYNHPGGQVRVTTQVVNEARVRIVVEDDGPGIAPGKIDRLFSPFERLGAEQTAVEGTGLGLAVARGMVNAMGGHISVTSELGRGSAFTVELDPAEPPSLPAVGAQTGAALRAAANARRSMKLLCIDDNPSHLDLVAQILAARPGVEMLSAGDGEAGIGLAREHRPDLILLDLGLPDLAGEDVLSRLKTDARTASVPVVIMSADAAGTQLDDLLKRGARSYLTKPISVAALLHIVDRTGDPVRAVA